MNTVTATPMRGQPPFLAPAQTFDPSTAHDPMPDYAEPVFSSGGSPDELSAAGQQYALAKMNSYAAAHLGADTDDLRCEVDDLRCQLAACDYSPAEFAAVLHDQAPGVLYSVTATQYVGSTGEYAVDPSQPVKIEARYEGWVAFPGVPVRHIEGARSLRDLAGQIVCEHKARRGLARVPVVAAV